ncbi:MAG: hypothetical protein K2Z81_14530 [Cyanobacteria bacterium]|nr:hypothetical protein [Cyanobacteriota bacterium]
MFDLKNDDARIAIPAEDYEKMVLIFNALTETSSILQEIQIDHEESHIYSLAAAKLVDIVAVASSRIRISTMRIFPNVPWNDLLRIRSLMPFEDTIVFGDCWNDLSKQIKNAIPAIKQIIEKTVPFQMKVTPQGVVEFQNVSLDQSVQSESAFGKKLTRAVPSKFSPQVMVRMCSSSDPAVQAHRDQLELWISNLPRSQRNCILGRLHCIDDDIGAMSAYWELFYLDYFRRKSWSAVKDPYLDGSRPDYLVVAEQASFVMEISGEWPPQKCQDAMVEYAKLLDILNRLKTPFFLEIQMAAWCSKLEIFNLVNHIKQWLTTVNPATRRAELELNIYGFQGRVAARPRGSIASTHGTIISWTTPDLEDPTKIGTVIRRKSQTYKRACEKWNRPYIIAVCLQDNKEIDELDICRTLFGAFRMKIEQTSRRITLQDLDQNVLAMGQHEHVSAVIINSRRLRNNRWEYDLRVFHNPWAQCPLDYKLFKGHPQLIPDSESGNIIDLVWTDFHRRAFFI